MKAKDGTDFPEDCMFCIAFIEYERNHKVANTNEQPEQTYEEEKQAFFEMSRKSMASRIGIEKYIEQPEQPDFELQPCDKCLQLTNHLNGICQKCKPQPEQPKFLKIPEMLVDEDVWLQVDKLVRLCDGNPSQVEFTVDAIIKLLKPEVPDPIDQQRESVKEFLTVWMQFPQKTIDKTMFQYDLFIGSKLLEGEK